MLYTFKNPLQKNKKKCLFKLIVNGKYLIFKCLELDPFLARISIQLDKEVQVIKESSVFVNLVKEISKKKIGIIDVEILGTYDSSFDILVAEYNALRDAAKEPKCLNVSFSNHEYYPNWIDQIEQKPNTQAQGYCDALGKYNVILPEKGAYRMIISAPGYLRMDTLIDCRYWMMIWKPCVIFRWCLCKKG